MTEGQQEAAADLSETAGRGGPGVAGFGAGAGEKCGTMTPTWAVAPWARSAHWLVTAKLPSSAQWYSTLKTPTLESTLVVPVSPGQLDMPPMVVKTGVP